MGSPVGVFTEDEVKHLTRKQRAALKKEVLKHLRTAPEIHKIIRADPKHLTKHPKIRRALRAKLRHRLKAK